MRLLELDLWTIVGWRALFASLATGLLWLALSGRGGATFGLPGVAGSVLTAVSALAFIAALKLTTVANVVAIYATLPLLAGGIAYLVLAERIERRVVVASVVCLGGVVLVAGGSPRPGDVAGNILAFVMTATFALLIVMARKVPALDLPRVNAVGSLLVAAAAPLMSTVVPPARDLLVLALFAMTTTAGAYILFLVGSRLIPSAEAGLIGLIDVPLAPLWVWLLFAERPHQAVLVGGLVILAAAGWTLWPRRSVPPLAGAGP